MLDGLGVEVLVVVKSFTFDAVGIMIPRAINGEAIDPVRGRLEIYRSVKEPRIFVPINTPLDSSPLPGISGFNFFNHKNGFLTIIIFLKVIRSSSPTSASLSKHETCCLRFKSVSDSNFLFSASHILISDFILFSFLASMMSGFPCWSEFSIARTTIDSSSSSVSHELKNLNGFGPKSTMDVLREMGHIFKVTCKLEAEKQ